MGLIEGIIAHILNNCTKRLKDQGSIIFSLRILMKRGVSISVFHLRNSMCSMSEINSSTQQNSQRTLFENGSGLFVGKVHLNARRYVRIKVDHADSLKLEGGKCMRLCEKECVKRVLVCYVCFVDVNFNE